MKKNENLKASDSYEIQILTLEKPGDQVLVVVTHKNLSSNANLIQSI